ncbi:hypothetical protein BDZ91DRAFT_789630 [Kalaharituber pfeilii]|nr:hypothetical protein BDZ91DRAFT_789630 [Kalaharituber pfeilii]
MYHTHAAQTTLTPSQIAMQQLAQYDRVGEYEYRSPPTASSRIFPHPSATSSRSRPEDLYQRVEHSPQLVYQANTLSRQFGAPAHQYGSSALGHGHLVPLKSTTTPPQTTSTAMVLAGHHASQQQQQQHHQQLVPVSLAPPPPPVVAPQPTANIVNANPVPTTSSTPPIPSTVAPPSEAANTVKPAPPSTPHSNTILIHIPLIPTPFRIAIEGTSSAPYSLTDKINNLLMNQSIQERIQNALSVPKPNGWILVERVNTEFLQLRDLLGAIKDGRLMTDGVIPWVCAGELVEGGVGYWCLGVCT